MLHALKDGDGIEKKGFFRVPFEDGVPEVDVGVGYVVEDGGSVTGFGEGVAEGEELGDEDVVLVEALADDVGVEVLEVEEGFAGGEEGGERRGVGLVA